MTVRLLVADDQELVRAGIVAVLGTQPDLSVVAEAGDGHAAIEAARAQRPDVVLMDIRMPRLDGIEATRQICRTAGLVSRIIILTTFDLDEYVYAALRAGASGFLLKDAPREQLYHAVRTVAAGDALLAPSVTRRLIEHHIRGTVPAPDLSDMVSRLTEREQEVLRLIAAGLSNAEIAARLFLGEATVRTHVGHIFAKTGSRDRAQAIVFAYRSGLVCPTSP
jgi:DNA-binding NarL/FixJ family response regulator